MATPAWLAATAGAPPLAAQINQFLVSHATTYIYTGALVASQSTAGTGSVASDGLWVAQSFTTGSGTSGIGRIVLTLAVTGTPGPLTLQLQSNSAGAPSGTVLGQVVIPPNWAPATAGAVSIPLPVAGLAPSSVYWIVAEPAGDAGDYFALSESNQTSGAATSVNGTTWSAQTYGLLYAVYDQSPVLPLVHTWADTGARVTAMTFNGTATPATIEEYTVAQDTGQYAYSTRSMTYSGTVLASVA